MVLGTGSHVGKTILVTALCRLAANRGLRVAPFKAQNMSLNSFVTRDGAEIARATAVQAIAARTEPTIHMNPILLKPKSDTVAQLIVHGRPVQDVAAEDYFASDRLDVIKRAAIDESIAELRRRYDLIVAEGAGSCAEPNLRARDVVNLDVAQRLRARAYVVADIDKGGVFAELLGTVEILRRTSPADLELIEGFIINKFRGDIRLLEPALAWIQSEVGLPVAGVMPYVPDLALEEEDRVTVRPTGAPEVDVVVIHLPHIANANDFDFLQAETGVRVRLVRHAAALGAPDAVILPGTKNTTWDLDHIRRTGLADAILAVRGAAVVVGVCGGYQMLGGVLQDEGLIESELGTSKGLGLLDIDFAFRRGKLVQQRDYQPTDENPFRAAGPVSGYEIHCGHITRRQSVALYRHRDGEEGAVSPDGTVIGTFVHDLFRNAPFTRAFVNYLRARKGLGPIAGPPPDVAALADTSCERLAALATAHLRLAPELG
jgi:adenosylcobyric acid synthase